MKSDFTFAKDDAHRFLPWHIGIMVALATFLLSLVFALGGWVGNHQQDYAANVSVIIPGSTPQLDDKTAQVKAVLAKEKTIANVKQVSENNLRELLAPWIGSGDALQDMSLPVVLDITLKDGKESLDEGKLKTALAEIEPTIELDAHNSWAEVFAAFIRILQGLAVVLVGTILGAMALMIVFSARASLHLHERTVNLLHAMGAEDLYIARQFQNEHFKIGLRSAGIGATVAAFAYWGLGLCVAGIKAPVLPTFEFSMPHMALVLLMPFACAMIVRMATRYSVLTQLGKIL